MKINDQVLSAFLDNELSEAEMEAVREAIILDESIAEQLAELASADAAIVNTYSQIDQVPLPNSVKALLDEDDKSASKISENNVVIFPLWKRTLNKVSEVKSLAAAAAVAAIIVTSNLVPFGSQPGDDKLQQFAFINQVLDVHTSGMPIKTDDNEILIRASFKSNTGDYCRQFKLTQTNSTDETIATEKIACKQQNTWQVVASSQPQPVSDTQTNQYQTATDMKALDTEIDRLIDGNFLNQQQEKNLINQDWKIQ